MVKNYLLEKRKYVIGSAAVLIVILYICRLFVLQISTDEYKQNADNKAFLNKIQYPYSGANSERNGDVHVFNQPDHEHYLRPRGVTNLKRVAS